MLDGEAAIRNALCAIYSNVPVILMCFFHVMKNCKEHLKGVPKPLRKQILKRIRSLHMSTSSVEFQLCLAAFSNFCIHHQLQSFLEYFLQTEFLQKGQTPFFPIQFVMFVHVLQDVQHLEM